MRRLIADLRPSTLDELGLGAALEALGERTRARRRDRGRGSTSTSTSTPAAARARLLGEIEDAVYRLVQEALNNAVHHGEADRVGSR